MRKVVVAIAVVAAVVLTSAGAAGGERAEGALNDSARLSVNVPVGWHVLRGWLSDVTDPAPRLAVASFPARLSRHSCACGFPNVVNFPRDGAFVFVWEYLHPSRRGLARTRSLPVHFHLGADRAVRQTCLGVSDTFGFRDAGRVFQVEIYLGPTAGSALRGRVAAMLESFRVASAA
jgi:hypothetical protein